jgi:hypothetical protein
LYITFRFYRRKNNKKALPNLIRQRFPDVSGITKHQQPGGRAGAGIMLIIMKMA